MSQSHLLAYDGIADIGYWGNVTSTIDWCEENYAVSPFVAEFMNTISNSSFLALAAYSIYSCIKNKLETRFIFTSLGFALVGIGSWLFHMTLKYEFQLLDELPMIYATCIPVWSIFSEGQTKCSSLKLGFSISIGALLLTITYMIFRNPTIHQIAYAILNVFIVGKSIQLTDEHVDDGKSREKLFKTVVVGTSSFLSGFLLWNLDVHLCSSWIDFRHYLGLPYGLVFELHAWWHILTGLGVYYFIVYLEFLRLFLKGDINDYDLVYHGYIIPEVKLLDKTTSLKESLKELRLDN